MLFRHILALADTSMMKTSLVSHGGLKNVDSVLRGLPSLAALTSAQNFKALNLVFLLLITCTGEVELMESVFERQ